MIFIEIIKLIYKNSFIYFCFYEFRSAIILAILFINMCILVKIWILDINLSVLLDAHVKA